MIKMARVVSFEMVKDENVIKISEKQKPENSFGDITALECKSGTDGMHIRKSLIAGLKKI
jgi:hypothetical protein